MRLLKLKEVMDITTMKRSSLYRGMELGTFPKPIKLGERSIAWRDTDIASWMSKKTSTVIPVKQLPYLIHNTKSNGMTDTEMLEKILANQRKIMQHFGIV